MCLRMNAPRSTGDVRFGYAAAISTAPLPSRPQRAELLELDAPEPIAFHVGDAVVQRDALVEKRVLRASADRRRCGLP